MIRKSIMVLAASAAIVLAQGPHGPRGQAAGAGIDMAKQSVVAGAISAVNIAYGAQYPSIQVDGKLVKVAPVWYLLENDMELKPGDSVSIVVAPGLPPNASYLYAIKISSISGQAELTLRDEQGYPEWMARGGKGGPNGGGSGGGAGAGLGTCIDPASVQDVSGTVDSVTMGAGVQMPRVILKTGDKLLTIKLGPERILLSQDFELTAGDKISAKIAYAACCGEFVALSVTNSAGKTVVLRNPDGTIAWK